MSGTVVSRGAVEGSLLRLGLEVDDLDLERVRVEVEERVGALPSPLRLPARAAVLLSAAASSSRTTALLPGVATAHRLLDSLTAAVTLDGSTSGERS